MIFTSRIYTLIYDRIESHCRGIFSGSINSATGTVPRCVFNSIVFTAPRRTNSPEINDK